MAGLVTRIKMAVAALRGAHFSGGNATYAWSQYLNARSQINYKAEVGDPTSNSAVATCLGWIVDNWPQARPYLLKTSVRGNDSSIYKHPLLDLLKRPNPLYGDRVLWEATLFDLLVDGNAYWHIIKGAYDVPIGLYWLPADDVDPRKFNDSDDTEWIGYYEHRCNGKTYKIAPEDIVHFRTGMDLNNPRKGRSRLRSVLAEVYTDNEAAATVNALLGNRALPGLIVSPKALETKNGFEVTKLTADQADDIERRAEGKFKGDGRGRTWVHSIPIDITEWGAKLSELATREIRRIPEERICAIFKIPPGVVKLGAGLDRNTMANAAMEDAQAWRNGLMPLHGIVSDAIDQQLLPQMEMRPELYSLRFDVTAVEALSENEDAKAKRIGDLWEKDIITHDVAVTELAYETDENRKGKYYSEVVTGGLQNDQATPVDPSAAKALREELAKKWAERSA